MDNDKQTAEEAARGYVRRYQDHSIDSLLYVVNPPATTIAESVFLAGVQWAQEHQFRDATEKILGDRWVIVGPGGTPISLTNATNEHASWQSLPLTEHTPEQRQKVIEEHKAEGFRAVKVKLVEVVE